MWLLLKFNFYIYFVSVWIYFLNLLFSKISTFLNVLFWISIHVSKDVSRSLLPLTYPLPSLHNTRLFQYFSESKLPTLYNTPIFCEQLKNTLFNDRILTCSQFKVIYWFQRCWHVYVWSYLYHSMFCMVFVLFLLKFLFTFFISTLYAYTVF